MGDMGDRITMFLAGDLEGEGELRERIYGHL